MKAEYCKELQDKCKEIVNHFKSELKTSFYSVNALRNMLESQVFGPVSSFYIDYFNDLYKQDYGLYHATCELIELYDTYNNKNNFKASNFDNCKDFIAAIFDKHYKDNNNQVEIKLSDEFIAFPKSVSLMMFIDVIIRFIAESVLLKGSKLISFDKIDIAKDEWNIKISVSKGRKKYNNRFVSKDIIAIINSLRNNENPFEDSISHKIVDFKGDAACKALSVINFISQINNIPAKLSISENSLLFDLFFNEKNLAATCNKAM